MNNFRSLLRKLVVAAIGFPLIIIGIILIPLPGPGLLVILAGLFVLAIEFEWAKHHKKRLKHHIGRLAKKAKR